ncbi:MAG: hypothetical protein GEU79_16590 [Acidimicrobiia bacterium]|nr:hypothetical protein [Acidimicrobiia bacterium]
MFRRRLAVLTALAMVLGLVPALLVSADTGFDDVPDDHVFAADIVWLADEGITLGCNPPENSNFCPEDAVTRGAMAAFLVRGLGLTEDGPSFDDTAGHVFEDDISKLAAAGITRGCNPPENTNFCPDEDVTRGAMAAFLHRALTREVPESPYGEFDPITISGGAGLGIEKVVSVPNDYVALVDVDYDDPAEEPDELETNIIVRSREADDSQVDLLVNEIGDYEGRRVINLNPERGRPVRSFSIDAGGPWTITLRPVSAAERFSTSISGSGDDIVVYTGSHTTLDWDFQPHDSDQNFRIMGYDQFASFTEYLVNEYPGGTGSSDFSTDSMLWDITGYGGDWTLDTHSH